MWTISAAQYWRISGGNFTSLPQHFKDNGYLTIGLGKIFHPNGPSNNSDCEYAKPLTLTLTLTLTLMLTLTLAPLTRYSWSREALDTTVDGKPCPQLNCYINTYHEPNGQNIYTSPAVHPQNCTDEERCA